MEAALNWALLHAGYRAIAEPPALTADHTRAAALAREGAFGEVLATLDRYQALHQGPGRTEAVAAAGGAEHWSHLKPVPPEMYLASQDVHDLPAATRLDGLVVFAFGCYTAGTPGESDFHHLYSHIPEEAATQPFVARLPQELLRRGALAFVGHVDRAWPYSFGWPGVGTQTDTFKSGLEALLVGEPIGRALEHFQEKYLDLNNTLTDQKLLYDYQMELPGGERLIPIWTARNDARAYILLGDPLVRLDPERLAPA